MFYVDTSMWYAAVDRADVDHATATRVLRAGDRLYTSGHVLVESWLLMNRRLGRGVAERFWETLRGGAAVVETVTPGDLEHAWATGRAFPDQNFSIVDRTSFAVMERLGLRCVATFDEDFAIYRFGLARDQAFTVIR